MRPAGAAFRTDPQPALPLRWPSLNSSHWRGTQVKRSWPFFSPTVAIQVGGVFAQIFLDVPAISSTREERFFPFSFRIHSYFPWIHFFLVTLLFYIFMYTLPVKSLNAWSHAMFFLDLLYFLLCRYKLKTSNMSKMYLCKKENMLNNSKYVFFLMKKWLFWRI